MSRPPWVSAYINTMPLLGPRVVCDGNSLTIGSGAVLSYPTQLGTLLGGSWTVVNTGTASETTQNRINVAPTNILARLDLTRSRNIAILWEATNEIYYRLISATPPSGATVPADLAGNESNYQAWCELIRSYDFKALVMTVLPRSNAPMTGGQITQFSVDRAAFNTWLRANWSTFADGIIDIAANVHLGPDGSEADLTYYSNDLVHLNDTGYGIVAALASTAVQAL